jgi:hypothetical protein
MPVQQQSSSGYNIYTIFAKRVSLYVLENRIYIYIEPERQLITRGWAQFRGRGGQQQPPTSQTRGVRCISLGAGAPLHGIRMFTGARTKLASAHLKHIAYAYGLGCLLHAQTTSTCSTAAVFHYRHRSAADSTNARLVRRPIHLYEQARGLQIHPSVLPVCLVLCALTARRVSIP